MNRPRSIRVRKGAGTRRERLDRGVKPILQRSRKAKTLEYKSGFPANWDHIPLNAEPAIARKAGVLAKVNRERTTLVWSENEQLSGQFKSRDWFAA